MKTFHLWAPIPFPALAILSALLSCAIACGQPPQTEGSAAPRAAGSEQGMELEPEREYRGGERVTATSCGVSWVVPSEYIGRMPAGSTVFLLGSNVESTMGLVVSLPQATTVDLASALNETQDSGDGMVMEPLGQPTVAGRRVTLDYSGSEHAGTAVGLLGGGGQGVIIFCFGPKAAAPGPGDLLQRLESSVRFSRPDPSRLIQDWNALLSGMMLKRMSSYTSGLSGGYSSESTLHLCGDGRYAYSSQSSVSVYVDGLSDGRTDQEQDTGRWRLEPNGLQMSLVLESESGETRTLALAYDGEKTFLDGERVFRVESDGCP